MEKIKTGQDRDEFVPDLECPQIRQGNPKQGRRGEHQDPERERGMDRKSINHGQGRSYEGSLPRGRFPSRRNPATLGRANTESNRDPARSSLWTERGRGHGGGRGGRNSQAACSISPAGFGGGRAFAARLWPFCSCASTAFKASISFDFWTATILRPIRSRAASYNCRSECDCSGCASDR